MRSAKKLLALVLTLTMALSFVLPAMASRTIDDFDDATTAKAVLDAKSPKDVYAEAVQNALDLKILTGSNVIGSDGKVTATNLNLGSPLTRAEFAVMLYKAVNGGISINEGHPQMNTASAVSYYSDGKNHWAKGYMNWFATRGISAGIGDDEDGIPQFAPDRPISFQEALLFSMRAIGIQPGREESFKYNLMSIVGIADELGMFEDLYWMDDVNADTGEYRIDRATACLLLWYTVQAPKVEYRTNQSWRETDASKSLLITAYNYTKFDRTVISDGNWFALDGNPGTSGKARLGTYTASGSSISDGSFTNVITLSADDTKKLGITTADVGRKIEFWYRAPAQSWQDVPQVFSSSFKYLDNVQNWVGIGGSPWVSGASNGPLSGDIQKMAGNSVALRAGTTYFINYRNEASTDDILKGAATGWNNWAGTKAMVGNASGWGALAYQADLPIRIIYENNDVKFVFFEQYHFVQFDGLESSGSNAGTIKLKMSADGNSGGHLFTQGGNATNENRAKPENIMGFAELDLKSGDFFLIAEMGMNRWKALPVEKIEGVRITDRYINKDNNRFIVAGGKTYEQVGLIVFGCGQGASVSTKFMEGAEYAAGAETTLYVWNGKVLFSNPPSAAKPQYAVVKSSRYDESFAGAGSDPTKTYFVDMLFSDGTSKVCQLAKESNQDAKIDGTTLTHGGANTELLLSGTNLNNILFQYTLNDDIITLKVPATAVEQAPASPSSIDAGKNRFPNTAGWNDLADKFIIDSSVIFVKIGSSVNWRVYNGATAPKLVVGTADTKSWLVTGELFSGNNDAIAAAAINLGTGGSIPGIESDTLWGVALSNPYEQYYDGKTRWAIDILNKDGVRETLYNDGGSMPAEFATIRPYKWVQRYGSGDSANDDNRAIFEYTKKSDGGWINSLTSLTVGNMSGQLTGVNKTLNILQLNGGGIDAFDAGKVKFYLIDGTGSKIVSIDDVPTWKDIKKYTTDTYVIFN
ncbi:MAG: S-layer homology domain-containing protein [Oscillospiraceae bacterium]|nr:S-layer homology domain-containing protein [Oscillospiraceae bacterium]